MSVGLVASSAIRDLRDKTIEVTATPAGNYVNNGTTGDVVNLFAITVPLGKTDSQFGYPCKISNGEVVSSPAGYLGVLVPPVAGSANPNLWGLRVFLLTTGLELANGAYPAGLLTPNAFTLRFRGPKGSC